MTFRPLVPTPAPDVFPLLSKELYELSSRRRTYVVRFLYCLALFTTGLVILYGSHAESRITEGQGRELFQRIVEVQCIAVLVLMPAMMCGSLAGEKERETLSLLLLTTMPGWSILIQKLLSRAIPMLGYVSLSFPLMAAAYGFGGVSTVAVYVAAGVLVLSVLQIGVISLMTSAYCRTTVEAFVSTYLVLLVLLLLGPCVPMNLFLYPMLQRFGDNPPQLQDVNLVDVAARTHLSLLSSLLAFGAAASWLHSRAFVPANNVLLKFFRALDEMYHSMNSLTGGVVLVDDDARLPLGNPIAWRETAKKSLGTFRYLFRVLTVLELPVLFCAKLISQNSVERTLTMSRLLYVLWIVATALLSIHSASVVSTERARQTLDVLLTTPLATRTILLEKMAGVRRLLLVLVVPFLSIFFFEHWFRDSNRDLRYVLQSVMVTGVLLWMLAWLGMFIGMRMKSQIRAIVVTMTVVLLACGVPPAIHWFLNSICHITLAPSWSAIWAVSPSVLIHLIETPVVIRESPGYVGLIALRGQSLDTLIYAATALFLVIGLVLRASCLWPADRLLGRVTPGTRPGVDDDEIAPRTVGSGSPDNVS